MSEFKLKKEDEIYAICIGDKTRLKTWLKRLQAIQKRIGKKGNPISITVEMLNPKTGLATTTIMDKYDEITLIGYENASTFRIVKKPIRDTTDPWEMIK